jgi:hypothetical protein
MIDNSNNAERAKGGDSLPNLVMPLVLSNDDGIRPAGKPDECFYCKQKVGQPHKSDCVILSRKVKVRYSFEIEIEVPWEWDAETIRFHRNDSSWCANNAIRELEEFTDDDARCLCQGFHCEVLEIPDAKPYRKDKDGNIQA